MTQGTSQVRTARETPLRASQALRPAWGAGIAAGLTVLAIGILGYHPYADDGGLYIAGVKRLLNPSLYPHFTSFVQEPTRLSLFGRVVTAAVRGSHAGLEPALFILQFISIWATVFAAWLVASYCWTTLPARLGAVSLLACCLGMPVAGTSLTIGDPYLTARSFSTPLGLFAIAAALSGERSAPEGRIRGLAFCLAACGVAALMHPVMAVYVAAATMLLLVTMRSSEPLRVRAPLALCAGLVIIALAAYFAAPQESAAAKTAALTRSYWFLSRWEWYEWVGLIAPLGILAWYARRQSRATRAASALARMALLLGLTGLAVSVCFSHQESPAYLIARLQPLRAFHLVYIVMVLIVGAELAERFLGRSGLRWAFAVLLLSSVMYFPARATYSHSAHIELRISHSQNKWVEAFLWVRDNTPVDALVAMDSEYNNAPDADTQNFRAIAERSAVPDGSKDGGVAAMARELAPSWLAGVRAQEGLDRLPHTMSPEAADRIRLTAIAPTGATWLILRADSPSGLPCPYRNTAVKVCRISGPPAQSKTPARDRGSLL